MIWNVIQNSQGELQLLEQGAAIPDDWTIVAETCNPEYLNYMNSIVENENA